MPVILSTLLSSAVREPTAAPIKANGVILFAFNCAGSEPEIAVRIKLCCTDTYEEVVCPRELTN